ncbi:hypothetical protein PS420_03560 [Pediococcus acidilactici]
MAKKVLIATYSRTGTTVKVAEALAELLPAADQFTIEVAPGTFSDEMMEVSEQATKQTETGNFPPLSKAVPDISPYDLILVGSPVWNGGTGNSNPFLPSKFTRLSRNSGAILYIWWRSRNF